MRPGTTGFAVAFWTVFGGIFGWLLLIKPPTWIFVVSFIAFSILWGSIMVMWGARHRRTVAQWAEQHGWTAAPDDDRTLVNLSTRYPFGRGTRRRSIDILRAPGGSWPVSSFTYRWATPSRRASRQSSGLNGSYAHVIAAELTGEYPFIEVSTKTIKAEDTVPFTTGNPDFDERFRVRTSDPGFAGRVLTPLLVNTLLAEPFDGRSWRVEGHTALWWRRGYTRVNAIEPATRLMQAIATAVAGTRVPSEVATNFPHPPPMPAPVETQLNSNEQSRPVPSASIGMFQDERVRQTFDAINQKFAGTPWLVQPTPDGLSVSANIINAQWWGILQKSGLREVYSYTVTFNPATGNCAITDELRTLTWQAGVDGQMRPFLGAAATMQRGRVITLRKTYIATPFEDTVADSTFNSESGRKALREVLTSFGWKEEFARDQKIGIWFAIGGCLVALVGAAIAVIANLS